MYLKIQKYSSLVILLTLKTRLTIFVKLNPATNNKFRPQKINFSYKRDFFTRYKLFDLYLFEDNIVKSCFEIILPIWVIIRKKFILIY